MKKDSVNGKNVVGTRLRQARERLSPAVPTGELSAWLLARGVTLSGPAIGNIEDGTRRVRDYELVALAACLNRSVAWLIEKSRTRMPGATSPRIATNGPPRRGGFPGRHTRMVRLNLKTKPEWNRNFPFSEVLQDGVRGEVAQSAGNDVPMHEKASHSRLPQGQ